MRIRILETRRASRALALGLGLLLLATWSILAEAGSAQACAGARQACAPVDTTTSTPAPVGAPPAAAAVAFARQARLALSAPALAADPAIQPVRPARPLKSDPPGDAAPAPAPAPASAPTRIALLLPTRSSTLAAAADALRAGFMASALRDGDGFKVELVSTGDSPREVLDAYARAAAASDIVVGPMSRSAVGALAASGAVARPTVALSVPEQGGPLPRLLLVAGLSIEDEARQVAQWAAREHPYGRALVLTGSAAWARRAAAAFEARWSQLGHTSQRAALPASGGRVAAPALEELKARLEIDAPELLFAALDVAELRQVRAGIGDAIPCYGGGAANPGRSPAAGTDELDGLRILDLPWIVQPDHPAAMVYPRPTDDGQPLDMQRLYALGIDAFRLARELALRQGAPFDIDGVTGQLVAAPAQARGNEGRGLQLRRSEAAAVYRGGQFEIVDKDR